MSRENQAVANRLSRVVSTLQAELRDQPFLPRELTERIQGTIDYCQTRVDRLTENTEIVETN